MDTKNNKGRITMKHWKKLSIEEQQDVIGIVSAKRRLPQLAIEKDWWVTASLKALSMTKYGSLMTFKGGTSLSKGWDIINRFSEDIDISLNREGIFSIKSSSKNQLAKIRRIARHYIIRDLPNELENSLRELGINDFIIEAETSRIDASGREQELIATTHPSTIYLHYKSIIPDISEYIAPTVKIEINCLSMDEPVEIKTIKPFTRDVMKNDEELEVQFPTVIPTRTFLEKIFLLHEEFQKEKPRSKRMSRHLYDIEKIMDLPFGNALYDNELFNNIIRHRSTFNKIEGIDYELHKPKTLNIIPPPAIIKEWENDYKSMQQNFIYDNINLTFAELIDRMQELTKRIREIGNK